jgi:SAM-dependent methyltransferase
VDLARRFLEVAAEGPANEATAGGAAPGALHWVRADATCLPLGDATVGGVVSLCQGAFGVPPLGSDDSVDASILAEVARILVPGGRLVLSAFSAYFQVRYLEDTDDFDVLAGRNREATEIHDPEGRRHPAELHTSCFTPRELRLLIDAAGLATNAIWSVRPGEYERQGADLDHPEFLVVAEKR